MFKPRIIATKPKVNLNEMGAFLPKTILFNALTKERQSLCTTTMAGTKNRTITIQKPSP